MHQLDRMEQRLERIEEALKALNDKEPTPAPQTDLPNWMNVGEAARHLGVSTQTMHRWRGIGEGPPCHKIGNSLRYERGELDTWTKEKATA